MPKGGARAGSGRPSISEELKTADLARKALIEKYGSLNTALQTILTMNNPILTKFVLEHAFGKPTEKVELSGGLNNKVEYDLTKVSDKTLKELLNAAAADQSS